MHTSFCANHAYVRLKSKLAGTTKDIRVFAQSEKKKSQILESKVSFSKHLASGMWTPVSISIYGEDKLERPENIINLPWNMSINNSLAIVDGPHKHLDRIIPPKPDIVPAGTRRQYNSAGTGMVINGFEAQMGVLNRDGPKRSPR